MCVSHPPVSLLCPSGDAQDLQAEAGGADSATDSVQHFHQQAEAAHQGPEARSPEVRGHGLKAPRGLLLPHPHWSHTVEDDLEFLAILLSLDHRCQPLAWRGLHSSGFIGMEPRAFFAHVK